MSAIWPCTLILVCSSTANAPAVGAAVEPFWQDIMSVRTLFSVCNESVARPRNGCVSVELVTGPNEVADRVQGIEHGGDDSLSDPPNRNPRSPSMLPWFFEGALPCSPASPTTLSGSQELKG